MTKTLLWGAALLFVALFVPDSASPKSAEGMSFSLATDKADQFAQITVRGELDIYAEGVIATGDTQRLLEFAREKRIEAARIVFNSPGGALIEGVQLGRAIRALGFNTAIGARPDAENKGSGICASACAYAFAGGVLRFISSEDDKLGLHQFSSPGGLSEQDAQQVSGVLVAYLSQMGVDANAFALATTSDPTGMVWLGADEAATLGFANNGVLPTEAEIRMIEMRPYLWVGQSKPGVDLRAILLCWNQEIALEAGLVTNAEQSANWADPDWAKRSYIEFDMEEDLVADSNTGAKAAGNAVWLSRELTPQHVRKFVAANDLGIWLDGFGALRVGGYIDLRPVKEEIRDYVHQCQAS